jgi:large subunit ribosomal protein L13
VLDGRFPDRVIELAVKRMVPSGPLTRRQVMKKLHRSMPVPEHPHDRPGSRESLDIAALNRQEQQARI